MGYLSKPLEEVVASHTDVWGKNALGGGTHERKNVLQYGHVWHVPEQGVQCGWSGGARVLWAIVDFSPYCA